MAHTYITKGSLVGMGNGDIELAGEEGLAGEEELVGQSIPFSTVLQDAVLSERQDIFAPSSLAHPLLDQHVMTTCMLLLWT